MGLTSNLKFFRGELSRTDIPLGERLLHVTDRATRVLRLTPHVSVNRRLFVELRAAPKQFPGLRDLKVRRGTLEDIGPLTTIDNTEPALVRQRFARGDLAYVGELEGEVLCHTWFHRGPTPFEEDRQAAAVWALDDSTYFSYNGAATKEARSSGVFVKVFQLGLREIFLEHGASCVQGFITDTNHPSLKMHDRMGFSVLGAFSTVVFPLGRLHRWESNGAARSWRAPHSGCDPVWLPPR